MTIIFSCRALLFAAVFAASITRAFPKCPQEDTDCIKKWQGMECTTPCVEDTIFTCLKGLCKEKECACKVERFRSACPQSEDCKKRDGVCEVGCLASDKYECLPNLCKESEYCTCKAPRVCPNTDRCSLQGGICDASCVPSLDGKIQIQCVDGLCADPTVDSACKCKIFTKCPQTADCKERGGTCTESCRPTDDGSVICVNDLCGDSKDCQCQIKTCPTTDKCNERGGRCNADCIPSTDGTTVQCLEGLCDETQQNVKCKCEVIKDCPTTDLCKNLNGRCEVNCRPNPGSTELCLDACDSKECQCHVRNNCKQSRACRAKGGRCEVGCVTSPLAQCVDDLCPDGPTLSSKCQCKIPTPCPDTDRCKTQGGTCEIDCVPSPDGTTVRCVDGCNLPGTDSPCRCKVVAKCQNSEKCKLQGGTCELDCVPSLDGTVQCLDGCEVAGSNIPCRCKVIKTQKPTEKPTRPPRPTRAPSPKPSPKPTKKMKPKCTQELTKCLLTFKGKCQKLCFDSQTHVCHKSLCKETYCKCKIKRGPNDGCKKTNKCTAKSGRCEVGCLPSATHVCKPDLCDSKICSCKAPRPPCPEKDWQCGDTITPCQPPGKPLCVCDIDTEGNPFCWNNDYCIESELCTNSLVCPPGKRCASSCCGFACLPECGLGGIGIDYRRRLPEGRDLQEQCEKSADGLVCPDSTTGQP